eukprot:scaffold49_cov409-Prasinococcus_capsulatus_cf.AAC.14
MKRVLDCFAPAAIQRAQPSQPPLETRAQSPPRRQTCSACLPSYPMCMCWLITGCSLPINESNHHTQHTGRWMHERTPIGAKLNTLPGARCAVEIEREFPRSRIACHTQRRTKA